MTERARAGITLPPELKDRAASEGSLSSTVERALAAYFDATRVHYVNSNAANVDDDGTAVYDQGVVATYGDREFGESLSPLAPGDGVVSYVSTSEVDYDGGARAYGVVQAPWSGDAVPADTQVYDSPDSEYHVPVNWLAVLGEADVVGPESVRTLTGRKTPQHDVETPDEEYQHGMRLLAEVVVGRAGLQGRV